MYVQVGPFKSLPFRSLPCEHRSLGTPSLAGHPPTGCPPRCPRREHHRLRCTPTHKLRTYTISSSFHWYCLSGIFSRSLDSAKLSTVLLVLVPSVRSFEDQPATVDGFQLANGLGRHSAHNFESQRRGCPSSPAERAGALRNHGFCTVRGASFRDRGSVGSTWRCAHGAVPG